MIKLIFNRTTNLNFYDLILVIKSVDTKIFGAFYCIRTLYRFSLFATITLIGIWSKFIKLALLQLSPDNIVFYLLPYGFKVIFQCFKFSSYSFSNHFHLFGVANVRQRSAYSIGLLFVIGLFLLFQSCLQVVQFLFDIHPQL